MPAAVKAKYAFTLTAEETFALSLDNVSDPTFVHTLGADSGTLDATTTPASTKAFSDTISLSAGAATLDLTSLAGPAGTTVDFTGLKVQLIKMSCPSTNTGGITADRGPSNPYNLFGADNASAEQVEVPPGGIVMMYHDDESEDVDATHKSVQFAGTGTDSISVLLVAG